MTMTATKGVNLPKRNRYHPKHHMCELKEYGRKQAKETSKLLMRGVSVARRRCAFAVRDMLSMRLTSDKPDNKNSQQDKLLDMCQEESRQRCE